MITGSIDVRLELVFNDLPKFFTKWEFKDINPNLCNNSSFVEKWAWNHDLFNLNTKSNCFWNNLPWFLTTTTHYGYPIYHSRSCCYSKRCHVAEAQHAMMAQYSRKVMQELHFVFQQVKAFQYMIVLITEFASLFHNDKCLKCAENTKFMAQMLQIVRPTPTRPTSQVSQD